MDLERRDAIQSGLPEAFAVVEEGLKVFKRLLDHQLQEELDVFGRFPSLFMGLVGKHDQWEHSNGSSCRGLRIMDSDGQVVADALHENDYANFLAEAVEPWSFLKFPYYSPLGTETGTYRVGPLARLNLCERIGSERADRELLEMRQRGGRVVTASLMYHLARLIEIVGCLEQMEVLLDDPEICSSHVRAHAEVNCLEAVGVSEAPRGTLFHHYRVDANGLIEKVNLIIATGQNNSAMNRTITQIAQHYLTPAVTQAAHLDEALLNRIEAGIRCYDPCLSCSTHAAGFMPLQVRLYSSTGELLEERTRA